MIAWLARRSLPRTRGRLALACLDEPVEILRDRWGIPHIYGRSRADVARAQGFVHAQDRLFQMEMIRRFAFGRLSEVVGGRALELDRTARRLRLRWSAERDARACDPATASVAEAYCQGVNAFLVSGPLPLELRLARVRPEPWTAVDVQAPAQMFALTLSGNWEAELARLRLGERLGPEAARRLDPRYPLDHPTVVPERRERAPDLPASLAERLGSGASNSFALAGSRTASGKPLLANDPHLLLGIPGIWHAQQASWDGGAWAGFTVPGAPALILGRNRDVAWGMTTAMVDTQDLFLERLHPDDPTRYEVEGEWVDGRLVREEIRVRGRRRAVVEEFLLTRHGPVVARRSVGSREAFALRWSHHEVGETMASLLDLEAARSAEEADRALERFAAPPHNFVLADAEGGVRYRLAGGPIPRRRAGDGSLPAPGADSSHEWEGWIEGRDVPRVVAPPDGLVVTANNRIGGEVEIPGEYLSGYRARRLRSLLEGREGVSPHEAARVLLDRLSLPGLELAAAVAGFRAADPLGRRLLETLAGWDGELGRDSAGGAVYGVLMGALEREVYAGETGDPALRLEPETLPGGLFERGRPSILRALAARDDRFLGRGRSWDDVLAHALAVAARELGPDESLWRRGRFHRLRFPHAFDTVPGLGRLLSRGPYEVGGDADTVNVMARAGPARGSMIGPGMRAVWDLADPDGNLVTLAPGQSGHAASAHYDDFVPGWLAGETVPLVMTRERVEGVAAERLLLEPVHARE
ncbi:MAG: penicillin acylase family protein [Thermoleophilia bacterium]|nr:penicillin acylase family protein [Thermoleophilia bacterium]